MQQCIKAEVVVWWLCDGRMTPAQTLRNIGCSHHLPHQFTTHMMDLGWKTVV